MKTPSPPASDAQEKLEFLGDPRHYRERPTRVEVIETHFAWVFLTERYAYKMKKPVQHASMDYRTLAARERGCRNELRLNRRLAPSVYIDVVALCRTRNGDLALNRGKSVVDWLVKMHRLPASRMLDRAIVEGTVTRADLETLTAVLCAFFKRKRREPMTAQAYRDRLRTRTLQTARDLRAPDLKLNRSRVNRVVRVQLEFIASARGLIEKRGAHLLQGHGDLRPEHVCLGSRPCVIDCLEFDRDLRRLDPAEEMAFLALECARLGRADLGGELVQRYRDAMQDPVPDALIRFYMSQRAVTRAKIAAWHMRDPQYSRRLWIARANSYLSDALRYARSALRDIGGERASLIRRQRPAAQQRSEGSARQHAPHGAAKQRSDGQRDELSGRGR